MALDGGVTPFRHQRNHQGAVMSWHLKNHYLEISIRLKLHCSRVVDILSMRNDFDMLR